MEQDDGRDSIAARDRPVVQGFQAWETATANVFRGFFCAPSGRIGTDPIFTMKRQKKASCVLGRSTASVFRVCWFAVRTAKCRGWWSPVSTILWKVLRKGKRKRRTG